MRLTNEEKETIITFDETQADAVIFTHNTSWQNHLEKKLGIMPTRDTGCGGKEYTVPKSRIRPPRAPVNLSPEQREKMGQRLREARHRASFAGEQAA